MEQFLDFLRFVAPACMLIGGSFAIVQAVFRLHWRIATVETQTKDGKQRMDKMEQVCESVVRIEENIKELLGERRHRERRTGV